MTFGNGTGKTDALGEFLCGVAKGNTWVNEVFCRSKLFDDLQEKRDREMLTIWWICNADLMKKGGTDYKAIKAHIPDAQFRAFDSKGVCHEIGIPIVKSDGTEGVVICQVKTHGQETTSFAGDNVDIIICDEPPPEQHWGEIMGRTRSKVGEAGARILIGGTPLNIAGYLQDLVEDPTLRETVVHLKGSTWENCADTELPEAEAEKRGFPKYEGKFLTRGVLTEKSIRDMINVWKKSGDPMEVIARTDGEFGNMVGRIYKKFNREVHVIKPFDIPKEWPILQFCDPHDARPDVVIWATVSPMDKLYIIGESPEQQYELLYSRDLDIPQTCKDWKESERERGWRIVRRYGDPNKMLDPDPYTKKLLVDLYRKCGINFNTNITDSLALGHNKVREFLDIDITKWMENPQDKSNQPKIFFFDTCVNCINFMEKYSTCVPDDLSKAFKEKVDEKYKDFPDVVRYAVMTFKPFKVWREIMERGRTGEWDRVKDKRKPKESKPEFKGRRLVNARMFK